MKAILRSLLGVLGVTAVLIALSILVLGAEATATFGERMFDSLSGRGGPGSPPWPPTMDNELRFYAALWLAYGILTLRAAARLDARMDDVPWLAGVFFLGGVGRFISWMAVGAPHPFFLFLMSAELGLPPILALVWLRLRGRK